MQETRKLSFSITGEFITKTAREMLRDNKLASALELLMNCLVTDQAPKLQILGLALAILNGDYELRGTYPGDDYGAVETSQHGQARNLMDHQESLRKKLSELEERNRALTQKLIFVQEYLRENAYLFDQREFEDAYRNEFDGDFFEKTDDDIEAESALQILSAWDNAQSNDAAMPSGPSPVEDMLARLHAGSEDDYGWLFPDGTFYPVDFGEHTKWAIDYLTEHDPEYQQKVLTGETRFDLATDTLEKQFKAVLLHNPQWGVAGISDETANRLTKTQREWLFDYYTKRNQPALANKLYQ